MKKEFFDAVWTFVGITVGAGIFGLPFVFHKAGFLTGLFVMSFVGIVLLLISLYLGEVVLRTKGKHQLSGLASRYLGENGKWIMFFANAVSIYGALTAYTVGSGQALAAIFGGSTLIFSILFFIVVAFVIYFGINMLETFESVFTPLKIAIALILSFLLVGFIKFDNLSGFSYSNLMIPYGVSIFAFAGLSALPEMNEELRNKKYMFWAILVGIIITYLIYLLFAFSVVGSVGKVDEVATVSLSKFGTGVSLFSNLFVLFAMATAFVALGFALKEDMTLDFGLSNSKSWFIVVIIPLLLILGGFFGFVKLIELSGAIGVGIILCLILLMHSKAKNCGERKPEYELADNKFLKVTLFLILVVGIIYTILSLV